MTEIQSATTDRTSLPHRVRLAVALAGLVALVTAVLMLMSAGEQKVAILLAAAPLVGYLLAAGPHASTYLFMFLMYSNAAVVAKSFHGMPELVVIALPGLLLVPIAYHLFVRRELPVVPRVTAWILAFVLIQAVGTMSARDPQIALDGLFVSLTEGLILYLLVVNAVRTPAALRGTIWALLAAGVFMGLFSIHQFLTDAYDRHYWGFAQMAGGGFGLEADGMEVHQGRASGPLGVENRYAQIMLMLFPLGLFRFWGEPRPIGRLLALVALAVIGAGWALTFSRGSFVGLGLTVLVMLAMGYLRLKHVVPVAVLVLAFLMTLPEFRARMDTLLDLPGWLSNRTSQAAPDGAVSGRATVMMAAARVYADHPVFGVGPTMFPHYAQEYGNKGGFRQLKTARQAHNLYLSIAAEYGTLGLISFFGAIVVTLRQLARARRLCQQRAPELTSLVTGFALVLTVYLTTGLFAHLSFVRYFWLMMALSAAACHIAEQATREPPDTADQGQPAPSPAESGATPPTA